MFSAHDSSAAWTQTGEVLLAAPLLTAAAALDYHETCGLTPEALTAFHRG